MGPVSSVAVKVEEEEEAKIVEQRPSSAPLPTGNVYFRLLRSAEHGHSTDLESAPPSSSPPPVLLQAAANLKEKPHHRLPSPAGGHSSKWNMTRMKVRNTGNLPAGGNNGDTFAR